MRFGQRAAEHREVLAEDEDEAAVDHPVAGDDAVAGRAVLVHPEVVVAMLDEHVPLFEGVGVEQQLDAFARGQLALLVLRLDALLAAAEPRAGAFGLELLDDVVHVVVPSGQLFVDSDCSKRSSRLRAAADGATLAARTSASVCGSAPRT